MPPTEGLARAPLPTPLWEISHVVTPMSIYSGYHERTSGKQQLLFKITYIATILTTWTLIEARHDTQAARSFSLAPCYMKNNSSTIMQPVASD
jgi:hypothetical protein